MWTFLLAPTRGYGGLAFFSHTLIPSFIGIFDMPCHSGQLLEF